MALGGQIATFWDGRWQDGNVAIMGAADHGTWQGTLVFDGARRFEGVTPDLDLHCQRLVRSAEAMGLAPTHDAGTLAEIVADGLTRFPAEAAIYIRPMMWSTEGSAGIIDADPGSTQMAICLEGLPLPAARPYALTVSSFRRPRQDTAVTEAKAACLYPNNARIVREARAQGFQNALSLDPEGFVAETASTNAFLVQDGVVRTPVPNGTFLAGITRARVIALLRGDGQAVDETRLTVDDFRAADEIFLTGNAAKITPVTRFEARDLQPGPVAARARALYWAYAHG